jgi:methyltransferase (TIGR00027 family)
VLLGAGYDTRPYRYASANQETIIFELDSLPTQDRKKRCLKKARIPVPNSLTFVPIDFNRQSLGNVLGEAGYRKDRTTLFIWEGVSYYLKAESVDRTLQFVRQTGQKENSIAFDYTVTITEENLQEGTASKNSSSR